MGSRAIRYRSRVLVVEGEDEDPAQFVEPRGRVIRPPLVQGEDDLAVGAGAERVAVRHAVLERLVVVDLAVDGEYGAAVGAEERLRPALHVDDREALMGEYRAFPRVDPAPVRTPVPLTPREVQRPAAQTRRAGFDLEDAEDGTHDEKRASRLGDESLGPRLDEEQTLTPAREEDRPALEVRIDAPGAVEPR